MKRTIAAVVLLGGCMILTGCKQQEATTDQSQQETQKAKGYIDTMAAVNKSSREKIASATEAENKRLNETLSADNNSQTTMQNVPSQINMDLAQTCKSATIKTSKGDITVSFHNADAPVTVANFCTLAQKGFYDGVIFHRVIKDFMIQGGDPTGTGTGGPGYKFADELPQAGAYKIGSLAMANAGPNTNGSQFFIVTGDAGVGLPPLYTLFGEVTSGLDVALAIQGVPTGAQDKPVDDVVITSVDVSVQ
ncbi:MAG: peptidylprolyl isomerase [Parcubacteria group bacterium]|jgi:peptidylprolyl isomerase